MFVTAEAGSPEIESLVTARLPAPTKPALEHMTIHLCSRRFFERNTPHI
jgi:hypothetical protein